MPGMENTSRKEDFMKSVNEVVAQLIEEGRITEESAKEKIESAEMIEDNIPEDTAKAAKLFVLSGIADEEELAGLL